MGNLLLRILAAVAVMIGIVLLIGSLLPRNFDVSTNVVIDAPPEKIFPYLNKIKLWSQWTMWNDHDVENLDIEYSGAEVGVGAVQTWTEPRGEGKLWITESQENEYVKFRSAFGDFPEMDSGLALTVVDGGTQVTWESRGSLPGGPFYGWFSFTFSSALQGEYDKALVKLQKICETR